MKVTNFCIVLFFTFLLSNAVAQEPEPVSSGMDQLAFMIGDWEGTGWHNRGEQGVLQFAQRVSTRAYMNGEILVSEQVVLDSADPNIELDRKVIIYSYDAGARLITARSMLPRGRARIAGLRVNDEGISWRSQEVGGRYYTKLSRQGNLVTTASYPLTGPQYFEMVLEPREKFQSAQLIR